MKTITIEAVLSSSEFMKIAVADAIELVAKVNGQTLEDHPQALSTWVLRM